MQSSDIKKFITGFLILAVLAGSSVFIFSSFSSPQETLTKSKDKGPAIGDNAFVEKLPEGSYETGSAATSTTLTDAFAEVLNSEISKQNPEGPVMEGTNTSLVMPDVESVLSEVLSPQNAAAMAASWDATKETGKIKVLNNYGERDLANYKKNLTDLFNSRTDLGKESLDGKSLQDVAPYKKSLQEALSNARDMDVPKPFMAFHTSFVRLLYYQNKALDLSATVENDPLRTSLILQAQKENYYKAIASFETEFNNLGKMKEFSQTRVPASFISQIQDIFRVNKAHALFGLGDITFDPSNLARMIWEYVQKVATEILKDQLVHRLVYQVINWVQGGGKPQFITNWNQFLQQAGNSAAGAAIQSLAPGMCRSFGPLIELQLERTYVSAPRITCTLDQVVRNVEDFYKRFENGSWIAYSAMSLPGGNYFGQLFEGSQIVELSQAAAKDSARAKSTASGGFLSKERCVEGDPDANPLVISKLTPGAESIVESYKADPNFVKIVDNSSDWSVYLCAENGWETTTPAKLVGDTMSEAIGNSPISRIVNAQDIAALVSALVNSGLNKLIKAGVRGVTGLVNGGAGENTGGTGGGGTPNACSGLSGQELADCQAINGSVSGSSNVDLSEQKVGLLKQADLFIDSLNNRIGYDRDWLSLSAQTQSLLEDVAQTCTAKASEIHSSITPSISQKSPTVSSDLENASSSLSNLMSIREDLTETSDVNQLLDLGSELNRLNATTISNAEEEAKTRYDNLTSLNQSARTALGDCNTQLSPLP